MREYLTAEQKKYVNEFELANGILKDQKGVLEWLSAPYQIFTFRSDEVCLIFYPHKVKSTGNHHVRVRDQNSKNQELASKLMRKLYRETPGQTFYRKAR